VSLYVLDASVAVKWVLPAERELYSENASKLLSQYTKGEVQLVVPDLFWPEVANVMWHASVRGRCSAEHARQGMENMLARPISTAPSRTLISDAFEMALRYGCTVYDCVYVELALRTASQLITADQKLMRALPVPAPVLWLGTW
jgi:predicted nucleic acid-binding protein